MSNIKHTAAGLLIFAMNIIYPQIQKVNKIIDTSIKKDNFNGAVILAKNGKTELLTYTGLANRHYNIGFSDTTKFHIFSLTKTFTAILIILSNTKDIKYLNKMREKLISAYYGQ